LGWGRQITERLPGPIGYRYSLVPRKGSQEERTLEAEATSEATAEEVMYKRVIVLSPMIANTWEERRMLQRFARIAVRDSMNRGEAPFHPLLQGSLSHIARHEDIRKDVIQFSQDIENILDKVSTMDNGREWIRQADLIAAYTFKDHNLDILSDSVLHSNSSILKDNRTLIWPPEIKKVYLAGPMEYAPQDGLDWRIEYAKELGEYLGIECVIPNHEEKHIVPDQAKFRQLKKEKPYEYIKIMRQLKEMDLNIVQNVDAVICNWNGEMMSGTVGEAQHATFHGVPVFLVTKKPLSDVPGWFLSCCDEVFPELSCLMMHLADLKWGDPDLVFNKIKK